MTKREKAYLDRVASLGCVVCRKPTLFLTNLDVSGFRTAIGERLFDRLREDGGGVIAFNWSSRRGQ